MEQTTDQMENSHEKKILPNIWFYKNGRASDCLRFSPIWEIRTSAQADATATSHCIFQQSKKKKQETENKKKKPYTHIQLGNKSSVHKYFLCNRKVFRVSEQSVSHGMAHAKDNDSNKLETRNSKRIFEFKLTKWSEKKQYWGALIPIRVCK